MTRHHPNRSNLADKLRHHTTPGSHVGEVIPITDARRVRRWDEPQPPDPYPDDPNTNPGARQHNPHHEHDDWESTNGLPTAERLVHHTTTARHRMIATHHNNTDHASFTANNTSTPSTRKLPLGLWAVAISIVAQATVTAAIEWGNADPVVAGATSIGIFACSVLLIIAEQITGRTGQ